MRHFGRSIRDAARAVRHAPGIPAACAAAIAVGAGAGSVVFALAYGILVRPLPFAAADRLVQITATNGARTLNFSLPEFDDWQTRTTSFDAVAAYATGQFAMSAGSETRPITGATVSGRFFETLQGPMLAGRPLGAGDDRSPAVVIGERLWRRQFNADAAVVGRAIVLNNESMAIAGIAAQTFAFPSPDVDVWVPLGHARPTAPPQWGMRGFRGFALVGRLRADATPAAATIDAGRVARQLAAEFPRFNRDTGVALVPLREALTRSARPVLWLLLAAAALVVLAVCANVSNLLIARGLAQRRDVAVRLALGAARRDIALQALAEVAWIAVAGLGGAVAIAALLTTLVRIAAANVVPSLAAVRVDLPVVVFAGALVIFAITIAAAGPVAHACAIPPIGALRETRTGQSRATRRTHRALVVLQIVTSVTLLIGTALVGRTLAALLHVSPGVQAERLAAAPLTLASPSFAAPPSQTAFLERVLLRVAAIPGVEHAGLISSLPPDGSQMRTAIASRARTPDAREVPSEIVAASADTFAALGVPLLHGRTFTTADTASAPRAVILSETAATLLFPGQDAVGQTLPLGAASGGTGVPLVVGVVGDVRFSGLASAAGAAVYLPFAQRPFRGTFLVTANGGGCDSSALDSGARDLRSRSRRRRRHAAALGRRGVGRDRRATAASRRAGLALAARGAHRRRRPVRRDDGGGVSTVTRVRRAHGARRASAANRRDGRRAGAGHGAGRNAGWRRAGHGRQARDGFVAVWRHGERSGVLCRGGSVHDRRRSAGRRGTGLARGARRARRGAEGGVDGSPIGRQP